MIYDVYIDKMLLPIPPDKISIKSKNLNKTYILTNGGEVNILKEDGLKTIHISVLLPNKRYPFSKYTLNLFIPPIEFLEKFERLKTEKKTFQFIVSRLELFNFDTFDTNLTVSLEDYTVNEEASNGTDIVVDMIFKEHKILSNKIIKVVENTSKNLKMSDSAKKYIEKINANNVSVSNREKAFIVKKRPINIDLKNKKVKINVNSTIWRITRQLKGNISELTNVMIKNKLKTYNQRLPELISYD